MSALLATLLNHPAIWRGDDCARIADTVPSGHLELDAVLPGGGWPRGALTELLVERPGIGELRLILPALSMLAREDRWLAFIAPPYLPYAPTLARCGIDPARLICVRTPVLQEQLWAAEQALRSSACSAVVMWPSQLDEKSARRFQLAAEEGHCVGVLYGKAGQPRASAAPLRLQLSAAGDGLAVKVLKRRGSQVAPLVLRSMLPPMPHPALRVQRHHEERALS
jgi:hypothetical protein